MTNIATRFVFVMDTPEGWVIKDDSLETTTDLKTWGHEMAKTYNADVDWYAYELEETVTDKEFQDRLDNDYEEWMQGMVSWYTPLNKGARVYTEVDYIECIKDDDTWLVDRFVVVREFCSSHLNWEHSKMAKGLHWWCPAGNRVVMTQDDFSHSVPVFWDRTGYIGRVYPLGNDEYRFVSNPNVAIETRDDAFILGECIEEGNYDDICRFLYNIEHVSWES